MGTVYYYLKGTEPSEKLTGFLRTLGIRSVSLKAADINRKVGDIAGLPNAVLNAAPDTGDAAATAPVLYQMPEVLIFSGLKDEELEAFMKGYRAAGVERVALKAVVTVHNAAWTLYALLRELEREHRMMTGGKQ